MNTAADTVAQETGVKSLLNVATSASMRPSFEGCNISTSLGFKQINYLVEAALLEHFAQSGLPVGALYDEHGIGFDIVELQTRLPTGLHIDDRPTLEVVPAGEDDGELRFKVTTTVQRGGATVTTAKSTVRVVLRIDPKVRQRSPVPAGLEPYVVDRLGYGGTEPAPREQDVLASLTEGRNAFGWKWRVPYFYCHFNERMQMTGFLRQMEEVVDLFLADRGLPIKPVLDTYRWIPVVTKSAIRLLDEVRMEEDLYTVYEVQDVFKDLLYTSEMTCYVLRDGELVQVACGTITHGYMTERGQQNWQLVEFDERTLRGLAGAR